MRALGGYLQVLSTCGTRCVTLVDACQTGAYIDAGQAHHTWSRGPCVQCACDPDIDPPWTTPIGDETFWADPNDPATDEVLGFMPDPASPADGLGVLLANSLRSDRSGPQRLSVTGTVAARSDRGLERYFDALNRIVGSACNCGPMQVRVRANCGCADLMATPEPPPVTHDTEPVLDYADGVYTSPTLTYDPAAPTEIWDDGARDLMDVRFVGWDYLSDRPGFDTCSGCRIIMHFDVGCPLMFGAERTILDRLGTAPFFPAGYECLPHRFVAVHPPCRHCGQGDCAGCAAIGPRTVPRRSRRIDRGFVPPIAYRRFSALYEPLAGRSDAGLRAVVTATRGDVYGLSISTQQATPGVAHAMTLEAQQWYCGQATCAAAQLGCLRDGYSLQVDYRDGTVTLIEPGGRCCEASQLVSRVGPAKQTLACGVRHWLNFDVGCESDGDLVVSAFASPAITT